MDCTVASKASLNWFGNSCGSFSFIMFSLCYYRYILFDCTLHFVQIWATHVLVEEFESRTHRCY
jgi:hypothetical protein